METLMMGFEARLVWLLANGEEVGNDFWCKDLCLCDGDSVREAVGLIENMSPEELLELVGIAKNRLRILETRSDEPKTIRITGDYRILIPEENNREVQMQPLCRSLFILFLKHPEGIVFSRLRSYREEFTEIYCTMSHRLDIEGMRGSIDRLLSHTGNSLYVQSSKLTRTLSAGIGSPVRLDGQPGGRRTISLEPVRVIWE